MKEEPFQTEKAIQTLEPDPLPSSISENTKMIVNMLL